MSRSHLKVYFSFEEDAQALNDSEKARLLLAMLRYAIDGKESNLTGNERFLFPVFKAQIDRDIETYNVKVNNGSKGGRPKTENNQDKPKETEKNLSESEKTETPKIEDRRQKIEDKRQKMNNLFAQFWAAYPRHEAKQTALKAFEKLNPDEELLDRIISAIEKQKGASQWKENGGQFIPYPSTWLNQHRWEDEVKNYKPSRNKLPAQDYEQRDYTGFEEEAIKRMMDWHPDEFGEYGEP